jgi:DNA-binding CsgD family transcriptional regulator
LLSITPATVSKHLEHVYAKLGVNSRTAALARLGMTREAA